ncbi:hypothetical protein N9954_03530 [Maribacter sp.]|nr:hypothetical protein [Maribacter sp.]
MKNLKSIAVKSGILACCMVFLFVTSCQKEKEENPIPDEGAVTEEEFIANLNDDFVATNYIATLERFEKSLGNSLEAKNVTPDQFRELYNSQDFGALETMLQDAEIKEASAAYLEAREQFLRAYPDLLDDLLQYTPKDALNDGIVVEAKAFKFLDNEVAERGCRRWSRSWWLHKACLAACGTGAAACSYSGPVCAAITVACVTFCNEYYCG